MPDDPVNEAAEETRGRPMRPIVIWVAEDAEQHGDVPGQSGRWVSFVGEWSGDWMVMVCVRRATAHRDPDQAKEDHRVVKRILKSVGHDAAAIFTRAGG